MSMLEQARKSVVEVDPDQARSELDAGEVDVFLDVREAHEWRKGYIEGALRIALDEVPEKADASDPDAEPALAGNSDARIIVYCATGVRSLLGAHALQKLGYSNVVSLAGGIRDWRAGGHPVQR
ncbi:MAG: rhodanese-like domain-containing protein [Actinomycetota bacterium]